MYFKSSISKNLDLIFFAIYIFFLPIAHFAAVQSITLLLFSLTVFIKYKKTISLTSLLGIKNIIWVFCILLILSIISLYFTPDLFSTLKEIKGELIKKFFILFIFYIYILNTDNNKIKKIFYIIVITLTIHTFINLIIWIEHGSWPYRAGGLIDSKGGERFGIWATYMLSISIAMLNINKKYAILLIAISLLSIISNQTRATFVALFVIIVSYYLLKNKNKKSKMIVLGMFISFATVFYLYSNHLPRRYNTKQIVDNLNLVLKLPPREFSKINIEPSTRYRLSMWKSAILYKTKHPFIPQGYGRMLFGKSIKQVFKNNPKNLPMKVYAQTHCEFLGIFYSLGIFGLITFIYFIFYNLKLSRSLYKNTKDTIQKSFSIFILLGCVGYTISMVFGSFFGDSEAELFYLLYGILLGIYKKNEKNILY